MSNIFREHIESVSSRFVSIVYVTLQTLESRGRDSLRSLLLDGDAQRLEIDRGANRTGMILLNCGKKIFDIWKL